MFPCSPGLELGQSETVLLKHNVTPFLDHHICSMSVSFWSVNTFFFGPKDPPPEFEMRFMVEKDKKKRQWLRERFPNVTIFKDMVDMAKKKAETHEDTFEDVPKVGGGNNT